MSTLRAWWNDEAPDEPARQWLRGAALPVDRQLNTVTAYTISSLICTLLGINPPMRAHAPGPDGLPGGITKQAVVAFNIAAATFDGVAIEAGGLAAFAPGTQPCIRDLPGMESDVTEPMPVHSIEERVTKLNAAGEALSKTTHSWRSRGRSGTIGHS